MGISVNQKKFVDYVRNTGPSLLFPSDATELRITDLQKMDTQGLSNRMYVFSITYYLGTRLYQNPFLLRVYRGSDEDRWIREYKSLKTLKAHGIPVPKAYALEVDSKKIGVPFMIMEKVEGLSSSHFLNTEKNALAVVDSLARTLASVHKLDPSVLFKRNGLDNQIEYVQEKILKIEKLVKLEYSTNFSIFARTKYLDAIRKLKEVKIEKDKPTLVHGDYGPDHVLFGKNGPVIVDWEGISMGDPAYDVGWMYHVLLLEGRYLIDHRFVSTKEQNAFNIDLREHFVKRYENYFGKRPANLEFYKILAAIRLAVVLDLYLRPGLFSICRNLRSMGLSRTLTQIIFARGSIKSFHNYCLEFLDDESILNM